MAEVLSPNITRIMFWPTKVRVNHYCEIITDSSLDTVFCNWIMVVAADPDVFDTLTLQEKFFHELLGGEDAIVGTVLINRNTDSCSLFLKL